MFAAKRKKVKVKIHFEFTVLTVRNLVGKLNGSEVYLEWKKGSAKEHKGKVRAVEVKNDEANFEGQVFSFPTNLMLDEATKNFEPKKIGLILRKTRRHGKGEKLGSKSVDLSTICADNFNEPRTYILGDAKKNPPALLVNIKAAWMKYNSKEIDRKNAPNKDKIVIDGQEYGLHTADTVSEMDSSHYSTSEDPPTEEEKPIEKGNSLPARTKKKKKKPKTNIIDDWKEKNKEENKMTKKLLEAETREKAWQSEKVELMAKLRDSESRFSNSFPEASRQPLPFAGGAASSNTVIVHDKVKESPEEPTIEASAKVLFETDLILRNKEEQIKELTATLSNVEAKLGQVEPKLHEEEGKRKGAEAKQHEEEAKRKAIEEHLAEVETKLKSAESKRKSAASKRKEEKAKRKEAESKLKEYETKLAQLEKDLVKAQQEHEASKDDHAKDEKKGALKPGSTDDFPVIVNSQVVVNKGHVAKLEKELTQSKSDLLDEVKKSEEMQDMIEQLQAEVEVLKKSASAGAGTGAESSERTSKKSFKEETKQVKELQKMVEKTEEKVASEAAKAEKKEKALKAKVHKLKHKIEEMKKHREKEKEEEKKHHKESKKKGASKEDKHKDEERQKELEEVKKALREKEDEILVLKGDASKRQRNAKDGGPAEPPLWKEKEERLKSKVERLHRRLAQANEEIKLKEKEMKNLHARYVSELAELRVGIDADGHSGESDSEGEEGEATVRRRKGVVAKRSQNSLFGGDGMGLVLERHALSGFVDNWIANATSDKHVKFWWIGSLVLFCLLVASIW